MSALGRISVNSSTGLSLNERFTQIHTIQPSAQEARPAGGRQRNRIKNRDIVNVDPVTTTRNRLLLQQLARKHTMQTAMKVKRRSLKASANVTAYALKRGTVKALRVAPNGRPMKANTLTKTATMRADLIALNRKPLRRTNSINARLGARRGSVGGAAERFAARRSGLRSRSRGRTPVPSGAAVLNGRGRSMSRSRAQSRGRSESNRRGRSRSRAGANPAVQRQQAVLPVKARLGVLAGRLGRREDVTTKFNYRGIAIGRVQKRPVGKAAQNLGNGGGGRLGRPRGRSALRSASRSRSRKGFSGPQQQQQQNQRQKRSGSLVNGKRRGRSQQRYVANGNNRINNTNNNNGNKRGVSRNGRQFNGKKQPQQQKKQQQQQQQQRRGRSQSRNGRGAGRNAGRNVKTVNKGALDKELDQYMATSKDAF